MTSKLTALFPNLGANSALIKHILDKGIIQSFPAATPIYWEGDACSHIAFLLSGEIRVYKSGQTGREITLYEIGPGDTCILNASCILSSSNYPANAVTRSQVDALLLPAREFQKLMAEYVEIRNFVFSLLSMRFSEVMALLEEVAFNRMDERLNEYLVEKSENNLLEATHQVIANDLGTSREVISRLLKEMERQGKVQLARNSIRLLDQSNITVSGD